MDKKFFNELCKEEAQLVEKLRVLRDFKQSFFEENITLPEIAESVNKVEHKIVQGSRSPASTTKKRYKNRTALTVPGMVLNSLSAINMGATQDIANKMIQLYPSIPLEKALKDTKHHLSLLSKKGKINILEKRPGRLGFIYQSIDDARDIL